MRFVDYIKQLVRLNNYESAALRGEVQALRDQHFAVESKAPYTDEQAQAASRIATLRACIRWNTNYRLITIENAAAVCFIKRRVPFGKMGLFRGNGALACTAFYFGQQAARFKEVFAKIGACV